MIRRMDRVGVIVGATVLLLSACGQSSDETTTGDDSTASNEAGATVGDDTTANHEAKETTLATTSSTEKGSTTSSSAPTTSSTTTSEGGSTSVSTDDPDGGEPIRGTGSIDPGLQPFIDDAVDQLVASESLAKSDITVQSARLVQWRDSSAGCPQPGMQYTQVVTDGSVIELIANTKTYWYHSGGTRGPFPCTSILREQG
ncbi:MAG: hypothetical protein GY773_33250 [Actinomycetia bacterium]|nr:hypothetical protein [Actinomycetes bacterium]